MNLLMPKQTDARDRTTCPHLYVIALLRFHILKRQHMYFSLYSLFPFFYIVLQTLLFRVIVTSIGDL